MGRVVLACKSDEERKMATCPVFAPYPLYTDRQAESVRHCVGFRISDLGLGSLVADHSPLQDCRWFDYEVSL